MKTANILNAAGPAATARTNNNCRKFVRCKAVLAVGMLTIVSHSAQANSPLETATSDRYLRAVASKLEQKQDADSLAAAGLIERAFNPARSQALLDRALQSEPARPDLLWLAMQLCAAALKCDTTLLEARLLTAAPGNGAVFLSQMQRGEKAGNAELTRQALQGFAHAERLDTYWTTLNARLTHAIIAGSALPASTALTDTIGYLVALPAPYLQTLTQSCKTAAAEVAEQERCRATAAVLQTADTVLLESIGHALALRSSPSDSPAHRAVETERKAARDRGGSFAEYDHLINTAQGAEKYLQLMSENRREQEVLALWTDYARKQPKISMRHKGPKNAP